MAEKVLEVDALSKRFGDFAALSKATFSVRERATHAIIGPNGAGKTTLVNVVTGLIKPSEGMVRLAGENITGLSAHYIARRGLIRTFQITSFFGDLTVRENVEVASVAFRKYRQPLSGSTRPDSVEDILGLLGLTVLANHRADNLSHGDQRLLEVAIALAAEPRVLLLDEPTAGMSPSETEGFVELVNTQLKGRQTIILIEHDMDVVMRTAERITVLQSGAVIADGTPAEVTGDSKVQEAYLGRAHN